MAGSAVYLLDGHPTGLAGLWDVLQNAFKEVGQSESWAILLANCNLWESALVMANVVIILALLLAYVSLSIHMHKKSKDPYQSTPYCPPLNIAKEFRERWRTRWRHQQYHVCVMNFYVIIDLITILAFPSCTFRR